MQTDTGTDKSDQAAEMDPRHLVGLVEHAKDQEAAVRVHQLRHHPVPPRHGADQAPVEVHHRRRELVCRLRSEPRERPDWDWRSARSERAVLRLCVRRPAGRLLAATGGSNVRDNTRRNRAFLHDRSCTLGTTHHGVRAKEWEECLYAGGGDAPGRRGRGRLTAATRVSVQASAISDQRRATDEVTARFGGWGTGLYQPAEGGDGVGAYRGTGAHARGGPVAVYQRTLPSVASQKDQANEIFTLKCGATAPPCTVVTDTQAKSGFK